MLVDRDEVLDTPAILKMLGFGGESNKITTGVYEIHHFGMSRWPECVKDQDVFKEYGVCDNYEQVIAEHEHIINPFKKFVITLTPIVKSDEPPFGGWRWHKWGEYIGTLKPQHEYIYDEDDSIEKVYVYNVYEVE